MNNGDFLKGMGIGVVAGLSAGMTMPRKRSKQNMVGKALKTAGDLVENISSAITR